MSTLEEYSNLTYNVLPPLGLHPYPTSSPDGPFLGRRFHTPLNINHLSSSFCRPATPHRPRLPSANKFLPSLDLHPYPANYPDKSFLDQSLLTRLATYHMSTSFRRWIMPARSNAPPSKSYNFSNLPPELRTMIWKYLLPRSQVLDVRRPQPIPTLLLHINQESRALACRYYELMKVPAPLHWCYIDWSLDYVVIPQERNCPSWALALPKLENPVILCPKWVHMKLPALPGGTDYTDYFHNLHN